MSRFRLLTTIWIALFGSHIEDGNRGRQRLDVVDGRGLVEQAMCCGEGRLDAREAAFTFDGFEEGCLLATDISARAQT